MAVSRALRRLLSVLELEEEQAHIALQRSLGELRRWEDARAVAIERERTGRRLVAASAGNGELLDRLAGIEEGRTGRRLAALLKIRIAEAARDALARREAFLAKRVERRQAATLVEQAQAAAASEANRRSQQLTDEWFLDRRRKSEAVQDHAGAHAPEHETGENSAAAVKADKKT